MMDKVKKTNKLIVPGSKETLDQVELAEEYALPVNDPITLENTTDTSELTERLNRQAQSQLGQSMPNDIYVK
jgi:hypothetical protein